jgi:hypothetical protein
MDSTRRLLLAHPQLGIGLHRPSGPRAQRVRLGEITLELLGRGGLEGQRAVEALRVLLVYSLGFAAFQAPRLRGDADGRSARAETAFAGLAEEEFPRMRGLARELAGPASGRQFHHRPALAAGRHRRSGRSGGLRDRCLGAT